MALLQLLAHADWKFFSDHQINKWQKILGQYRERISRHDVKDLADRLTGAKYAEVSGLIEKIEAGKCQADWQNLIGPFEVMPSDEELKTNRIKELQSSKLKELIT